MPLVRGNSRKVVSQNIAELHGGNTYQHTAEKFGAERANKQAVAIALSQARQRADGGGLMGVAPFDPMLQAPQQSDGVPMPGGMPMLPPHFAAPAASPGAPQGGLPNPSPSLPMPAAQFGMTPQPSSNGLAPGAVNPFSQPPAPGGVTPAMGQPQNMEGAPQGIAPFVPPARAMGGSTGVGGFNMAKEAHMRPGFVEGSEMRKLTRGPILSAVSGRTDAHKAMVPSGSYVLPADVVSGRGQGNTIAGANVFQRMFKMGPYGTPAGSMRPGHTMPHGMSAPHAPAMLAAGGGADDEYDEHGNKLVPVDLAGGEVVVPPENIMAVVHPNLKTAHEILDRFVIHERNKLRKTLARLPGPAKD